MAAALQPFGLVHAVLAAQLLTVGRRLDLGVRGRGDRAPRAQADRLPEAARERDLAGVVQPLAPEEHDLPAQQRGPDTGDGRVVERAGEVHAVDVGADVPGGGAHVEAALRCP